MANIVDTIDHTALVDLITAGIVREATAVGQDDGWSITVNYGRVKRTLAARRGNRRVFRHLESLVSYLQDVGIEHLAVDSSRYRPEKIKQTRLRPDTAQRMKHQAEVLKYDRWFREQVEEAIKAADSPDAVFHDSEEVFNKLEHRAGMRGARNAR